MSLSTLPLSYCTNVHPGRSQAEVRQGLRDFTVPVRDELDEPLAAGLWLARSVTRELLQSSRTLPEFSDELAANGLTCHTLNAFPYGDFHSERVKENVYIPNWSENDRLNYTHECARVLAELLPETAQGSLSTVPLGFKELPHPPDFLDRCIDQLLTLAHRLDEIHDETGKLIRLAIEPEPFCVLETTAETIAFFERLRTTAESRSEADLAERYLGVCYDVCHQAVEFEDVALSIAALQRADIRINKVHITCALQLDRPAENSEGRQALAAYVEPRYLHQTLGRLPDGTIARCVDLTEELTRNPNTEFQNAETWRIHFHVPVDAERLGPLETTRADLKSALAAVSQLEYAPHLEVETYTWEVLPGRESSNLVTGLTNELRATRRLLQDVASTNGNE